MAAGHTMAHDRVPRSAIQWIGLHQFPGPSFLPHAVCEPVPCLLQCAMLCRVMLLPRMYPVYCRPNIWPSEHLPELETGERLEEV